MEMEDVKFGYFNGNMVSYATNYQPVKHSYLIIRIIKAQNDAGRKSATWSFMLKSFFLLKYLQRGS